MENDDPNRPDSSDVQYSVDNSTDHSTDDSTDHSTGSSARRDPRVDAADAPRELTNGRRPLVGRRTFLRSVGAAGAVGSLALGASTPAAAINTVGDRWHDSRTWRRDFVSDSDILDIAQHNVVEYVDYGYADGVLYRYFDVTTVSAATHRYGEGDDHRPALSKFGFDVSSGHNATTSGIDAYDSDVVHAGPPKTESEVLAEYPLQSWELDDTDEVKQQDPVQYETDSGSLVLVDLLAFLLSTSSTPVVAAAGAYAGVAMLALGILELMAGADDVGGESYEWYYGIDSPYAVSVAHYNSLPVQMTEGEDGTFYVTGTVTADSWETGPSWRSLETPVFFKGKSGL